MGDAFCRHLVKFSGIMTYNDVDIEADVLQVKRDGAFQGQIGQESEE